jgi:Flp pilus assembly protein TadD
MRKPGERTWLGAILVLGLALRLAYHTEVRNRADFRSLGLDELYHDYWARGLVTGDWTPPPDYADPQIRITPFFRPPGYPHFVAAVYALAGVRPASVRATQMLLGLLNVLLAFRIGRRVFGPRAALIWAGLMTFYWSFIYFEAFLLAPAPTITLLLLLFDAALRWSDSGRVRHAALSGLLLGLCALTLPNILLFGVALPFWARRTAGGGLRAVLAFASAAALTIAPATIRNGRVSGEFIAISSNAGINLLFGNHPGSDGYSAAHPQYRNWSCFDYPAFVRSVGAEIGHPVTHREASRHFARRALDFVRRHPRQALRQTLRKALLFWGPLEVGNEKVDERERAASRVLRVLPVNFALIFSLALVSAGCLLVERRGRADGAARAFSLAALLMTTLFLSYLPFIVAGRYRVPLVPFLLLFGAYGLDRLAGLMQARAVRPVAAAYLAWAALFVLASRNFAGYRPDEAAWHFDRGVALERLGQPDAARAEYARCLQVQPSHPRALYNIARIAAAQGRSDEAIAAYEKAIDLQPDYAKARNNLAMALRAQGRFDEAIAHLQAAAAADPRIPEILYNLASALVQRGRLAEAVPALQDALARHPGFAAAPEARHSLACALFILGDYTNGVANLEAALRAMPGKPEWLNDFARSMLLGNTGPEGWRKEALRLAQSACALFMEAPPICLDTLAMALAANGENEAAARAQRKAIERLGPQTPPGIRAEYEARLRSYEDARAGP